MPAGRWARSDRVQWPRTRGELPSDSGQVQRTERGPFHECPGHRRWRQHVKILLTGRETRRRFESGPKMTAEDMVEGVENAAAGWTFDVVSLGYPGPVFGVAPYRTEEPCPGLGRL